MGPQSKECASRVAEQPEHDLRLLEMMIHVQMTWLLEIKHDYHTLRSSQSRFPQMRLILFETTNIGPMKQTRDGNLKISISISWIKDSRGSDTIFDPLAFNFAGR
jgi:hypothetical protein